MSDFRPSDDGPSWPEEDLRPEEGERTSWLDHDLPSDTHEPEPTPESPAEPDWSLPWDRPAQEPMEEESEPWPVYQPPDGAARDAGQPEPDQANEPEQPQDQGAEADAPPSPEPWSEPAPEPERDQWRWREREPLREPVPGSWREPEHAPQPEPPEPLVLDEPTEPAAEYAAEPPADEPPVEQPPAEEQPPDVQPPTEEQRPDEQPAEREEPVPVVPAVETAAATTAFDGGGGWDPRLDGERRRPTTAEQAVPWMIGVILALAGMVIVLLALIFTFPGGLTGSASPTPTASGEPSTAESQIAVASGQPSASAEPTPTPVPTPTPTPVPEYGALEMVYLGRPSGVAPIYLLRRDFSVDEDPTIMAQAEQGVSAFAWAPDGRIGAAIIANRAVALEPGSSARPIADDVSAISWGWDSSTLYAVRITRDGANDSTEILQIDFASAEVQTLATITYPHPVTAPDPKLKEAQFVDDGGLVRLYAVADGNLVLWVLGAPATYRIDPGDGTVTEATGQPVLWAPDGRQRISLSESGSTTTIGLLGPGEEQMASVEVTGLVSHVRWAPASNEIVFTLGHLSNAGGVRQDLYVWDLADGEAPMALTSNGVSFGASWVGVSPNWMPARS